MGKYFKVVEHELYNYKIKDNKKIVHLSDIHFGYNSEPYLLSNLYEKVRKLYPDYIVISGDMYNTVDEIKNRDLTYYYLDFFYSLQKLAPVFVCIGNHETMAPNKGYCPDYVFLNKLDKLPNIHVLDNKQYEDDNIIVGGYTIPYASYFDSNERKNIILDDMKRREDVFKVTKSKPSILLTHSPEKLNDVDIQKYIDNYDLICTGHMHNGMLLPVLDEIIPGNRGIVSPINEILPSSARGTIKLGDDSYMILNGGYTKVRMSPFLNSFYPREIDIINMVNSTENNQVYSKKINYTR